MNIGYLNFQVSSSDPSIALHFDVKLNNTTIFSNFIQDPILLSIPLEELEEQHVLTMTMSGKRIEHTEIDNNGQIVQDVLLKIDNINFDGIVVDKIVYEQSCYTHDFNGTQLIPVKESFYGNMGCNGTVELKFHTPFYLWLLENM